MAQVRLGGGHGDAVFDFGNGRILIVENVTNLATLADDFSVI